MLTTCKGKGACARADVSSAMSGVYTILFMRVSLLSLCLMPLLSGAPGPEIDFATVPEGRVLLTQRDDYIVRLSAFDRAARMKTGRAVTEDEFLKFVSSNVLAWEPEEESEVRAVWRELSPKLARWSLPFPATVHFVKTTGDEEGDAEYTRGNEIVLPRSALEKSKAASLEGTIAHELFHILSRNAPRLRDRLYAIIGFQPCGEIPFPPALASRKLTNPDAPKNDHCIRLRVGQKEIWAVPILFSKAEHFDVAKGGVFFQYAELKLLRVERTGELATAPASYDPVNPELLSIDQVSGFFEQVGRNTNYIIHPEEILADNFEFLLIGRTGLASPEVQTKLALALDQASGGR